MIGRCGAAPVARQRSGWLAGLILLCWFGTVLGQSLRDPTVAPAEAGAGTGVSGAGAEPRGIGAQAIIVREGRPHLVIGSRVYAQGQKIGMARIERISETEVWLREDGVVRKVPRFPGVKRSTGSSTEQALKLPLAPAPNREVHPNDKKSPRRD